MQQLPLQLQTTETVLCRLWRGKLCVCICIYIYIYIYIYWKPSELIISCCWVFLIIYTFTFEVYRTIIIQDLFMFACERELERKSECSLMAHTLEFFLIRSKRIFSSLTSATTEGGRTSDCKTCGLNSG